MAIFCLEIRQQQHLRNFFGPFWNRPNSVRKKLENILV